MVEHPEDTVQPWMRMLYNLGCPLVYREQEEAEGEVNVQDLEYADDMALVSNSMDTLEETIQAFNGLCVGTGLTNSTRKGKILAVCPVNSHGSPPRSVSLQQEPVELMGEFEYLGSTISHCLGTIVYLPSIRSVL